MTEVLRSDLAAIVAAIFDLHQLSMPEGILMYSDEFPILENLYFVTSFIKLSAIEQQLQPFIYFGGHLGGHFGFNHLDNLHNFTLSEIHPT